MAAAQNAKGEKDKASPFSPENRYIDLKKEQAADRKYQAELHAYNERKSDARFAFQEEQAALNRQENCRCGCLTAKIGVQTVELLIGVLTVKTAQR